MSTHALSRRVILQLRKLTVFLKCYSLKVLYAIKRRGTITNRTLLNVSAGKNIGIYYTAKYFPSRNSMLPNSVFVRSIVRLVAMKKVIASLTSWLSVTVPPCNLN